MDIDLDIESIVESTMVLRPELLLHPTVPKPLHGVNPRSIKGQKWWDETRRKVYAKNNFHCMACGIYRGNVTPRAVLHAHESYEIDYEVGKVSLVEIVALCPSCHDIIHSQRYGILFDKGVIDVQDAWELERHKELVLKDEGLLWKEEVESVHKVKCAKLRWEDWFLELDGKKYYSRFKDEGEWRKYYAKYGKNSKSI